MKRVLVLLVTLLVATPAGAAPKTRTTKPHAKPAKALAAKRLDKAGKKQVAKPVGTRARVAFSLAGELRPAREVIGRREEPLTLEEDIAKQIEKLLRGPLRSGITGLYVADARTGEPLFAVNADDPLNPASNVKMISMATALELLRPSFKYTTRLLGPDPDATGAVRGDVYLLGTWDPTLTTEDMMELADQLAARGVKRIDGDILVGSDPTRDGIYRAMVPIEIRAGEPGQPPTAHAPAGFDLVELAVTAKTEKRARKRHRLTFREETIVNAQGHKRIKLTIGGAIGKGGETLYAMYTKERTLVASHALRAALRAHQIAVGGDVRVMELDDFVRTSVDAAGLPVELARHESKSLQDIVTRVNKWSINWLADRVIMTAAALARRTTPSMDVAIDAMYAWLQRHPQLGKDQVIIDTGSGLSYRTRITPQALVKIVRAAAGYVEGSDEAVAKAWRGSLSVAGTDGTLRHRFRVPEIKGHVRGKTGTLSTAIALTGLLDLDPARPLAFSIVTNTLRPLKKAFVRKAHEQLVGLLAKYVAATAKPASGPPAAASPTTSSTPREPTPAASTKTSGKPSEPPSAVSMPNDKPGEAAPAGSAIDEASTGAPEEPAEPQPDPDLDVETVNGK
jgi:D-alanyl-D-alanine carboxypeptidase/D-alanyl-D-alanine-endopeptidase (penicillin-binding protein 4)